MTLEHIIAISDKRVMNTYMDDYGTEFYTVKREYKDYLYSEYNCVSACASCNTSKNNKPMSEWLKYI